MTVGWSRHTERCIGVNGNGNDWKHWPSRRCAERGDRSAICSLFSTGCYVVRTYLSYVLYVRS